MAEAASKVGDWEVEAAVLLLTKLDVVTLAASAVGDCRVGFRGRPGGFPLGILFRTLLGLVLRAASVIQHRAEMCARYFCWCECGLGRSWIVQRQTRVGVSPTKRVNGGYKHDRSFNVRHLATEGGLEPLQQTLLDTT